MRKKLSAIGNSLGIIIEKPILELLDIDRDTELDVKTDGERLVIEPVRKRGHRERVSWASTRCFEALRNHEEVGEVSDPEFLTVEHVLKFSTRRATGQRLRRREGIRGKGLLELVLALVFLKSIGIDGSTPRR